MSREDQFQSIVTKNRTIPSRERCYEGGKAKYRSHGKLESSKSMYSSGTYERERERERRVPGKQGLVCRHKELVKAVLN